MRVKHLPIFYFILIFLFIIYSLLLSSCDSCAHISAYSGTTHNRMLYGHDDSRTDSWGMKKSDNPYYVKPIKRVVHYHNYYKN